MAKRAKKTTPLERIIAAKNLAKKINAGELHNDPWPVMCPHCEGQPQELVPVKWVEFVARFPYRVVHICGRSRGYCNGESAVIECVACDGLGTVIVS